MKHTKKDPDDLFSGPLEVNVTVLKYRGEAQGKKSKTSSGPAASSGLLVIDGERTHQSGQVSHFHRQ